MNRSEFGDQRPGLWPILFIILGTKPPLGSIAELVIMSLDGLVSKLEHDVTCYTDPILPLQLLILAKTNRHLGVLQARFTLGNVSIAA